VIRQLIGTPTSEVVHAHGANLAADHVGLGLRSRGAGRCPRIAPVRKAARGVEISLVRNRKIPGTVSVSVPDQTSLSSEIDEPSIRIRRSPPGMDDTDHARFPRFSAELRERDHQGFRAVSRLTGAYIVPTREWQSENHFSFRQEQSVVRLVRNRREEKPERSPGGGPASAEILLYEIKMCQ
jgi:hypothetical protein